MLKKLGEIFLISIVLFSIMGASFAYAESVDEIKQNINSHNDKIKQLEEEIKKYEKQIEVVGTEAKSLQNTVKVLDINQKKIGTEIKKTETNIQKTNSPKVEANAKILSDMQQKDDETLIESFLTNKSLADVFNEYESIGQFQQKVREQSKELTLYKEKLSDKKVVTESEKQKLVSLKSELGDQNKILDINKKEKSNLLVVTKSKEAEYKKILSERQAEKERFEKELFSFESELKRAIDPNSFPSSGKGILSWPLDNVFITQNFGKTVDAKKLYVSGTHNGVDFRASRGTPVKATLRGVIKGTGNTDAQKGCYSYGKWILIEHPNGLSTLYAHLDLIKVSGGQSVETGEIIGYSGQTGYSTGPHLHLTLYASQGVEIQKYSSSINCKNMTIPISGINAYLDPLLYF